MIRHIRLIYDFLLKEESRAFKYIRKHPRRIGMLSLDAILSVALVSAGFLYASASSRNETSLALMRVGAVALPSSEFVEHIRFDGGRAYWLGDISGFDIVHDDSIDERRSISYVKKGSDPQDLGRPQITVVTYRTSMNVNGVREFGTWSEPFTTVAASGLIVGYDLNSMMGEIISINGTSDTVYIHYPTAQTLLTLMRNAGSLKLVA
ncbi:MAG: hypothetical protein Q8L08_08640 [Candidatus Nanopelagicaceae bacterium]|nr:hypothetical protein [Candidatus Nanopelagicaceae bacterium]